MQPSNSLITLGLGAAVALCAAAPTQAAPFVIRQANDDSTRVGHKKLVLAAASKDKASQDTDSNAAVSKANPSAIAATDTKETTLQAQQAQNSQPENTPSMELPQAEPADPVVKPGDTPELPSNPPTPSPPPSPAAASSSNEPAPEYLNPDPNPLSFPTQPEEVQIVGTQPLTLKQAIELAIRNSRSLQESRLTLERTQAALRESEAQNLPTVSANADLTFSSQDTAVPNATNTGFDGTSATDRTTLSATVQTSYSLFTSGQRSASIRSARGQVRAQELQLESDTEQLILDVTNNYYDLQGAIEQVRIAEDTLTQAEQSLKDAQALERAGVGTRFDVLQAEVDRANAQQDLTQQISQQEIARRQIVQQLSLSQSVDVTAADPIVPAGVWDLSLEQSIVLAYKNRAELEQQLVQREISVQNRRRALAQLRPQVTLQASSGVTRTLDTNQGAVFEGFLPNFSASLGVNWTIFDGGQSKAQADQAESNIAIAENQFASNREEIRFQVEQAYSTLRSSFDNIQVTALAVQNAQEALRLARLRFQAGVGTQTDVLQQQTALTQAEVNSLTAILNYNRALASLQRQISNYPEGNLADTP
jgi:outer membrane protein TolC